MMSSTRDPRRSRRPRWLLAVGVLMLSVVAAACVPAPPEPPPSNPENCEAPAGSVPGAVKIMGCSRLSVDQIVAWFDSVTKAPTWSYKASVPLRDLVGYYIDEGNAEGVGGDVAFAQAVVETGYFSSDFTRDRNNFAGIGAIDSAPGNAAYFPDARTGVRAQIQHLRAYADPAATTCAVPPLHNACVDPRFHLVSPKGKSPTWNGLAGTWASSGDYGYSIVGQPGDKYKGVYTKMLEKYGLPLA